MRQIKFIFILILTLSFQSWSNADDISEFEIEGITLYDSALKHYSTNELKKDVINNYSNEDRNKLFILKPLYQRSLIVAAGPLANFVLAIIIFIIIFIIHIR